MMSIEFIKTSIYQREVVYFQIAFFSSNNQILNTGYCFYVCKMSTFSFRSIVILLYFFSMIYYFNISLSSIRSNNN